MTPTIRPRFLTLAAAALLAGCSAESSVAPITPTSLDAVFSEMSLPAISNAATAAAAVKGPTSPLAMSAPTGCNYVIASRSFACAPITASGATITRSYQLLTATGEPVSSFDASIAGVRVQSTITGTVTGSLGTFTVDGSQDQTLSGLQTSTHVLNGTSAITLGGNGGASANQPFTIAMKFTTTALVIPNDPSANPYPPSGTIALDETFSFWGQAPIKGYVVLTFNGTSKVTVTVDGVSLRGCRVIDLSSTTPGCSES
jgi:hypothetical protein